MSSASRQDRIDELFAQAADLADGERVRFLDGACGDDAALRAEVERLLAAHDQAQKATEFLAPPVSDEQLFDESTSTRFHPLLGQRIGPYQVQRYLGGGGFGQVYLASRADDYQQKVALKVLRSDIEVDSRLRARFELERQILADLQHENIARLLYGGALENGRPYIVMEYVKGEPITRYCDDKRLSLDDRLRLFRQVCQAVGYAHSYGVIHRDLKPGNVLVSDASDGEGKVKLLDFGIAKMIDPISRRRMVTISEGGMPLTPEYASPEQVRGQGISTASDVYSLGVMLYELLTGHRPYQFARSTPAEFEQVICNVEPRNPSTIVQQPLRIRRDDGTEDVRSAETLAEARGGDMQTLRKQLKGDLEQIVLKALRKEPKDRYPTVEALVEDLERFSSRRPVRARPVGRFERGWRWARRNRAVAGLSAAVAILLLAATIASCLAALHMANLARSNALALAKAERNQYVAQIRLIDHAIEAGDVIHARLALEATPVHLRHWEWRYAARQLSQELCTFRGHTGGVTTIAVSPDGRSIVSGGHDYTLRLWDAETGKQLRSFAGHDGSVFSVAFSPDGRRIVSGGNDNTLKLWDAVGGQEIRTLRGHTEPVISVAFSPDGRRIVSGGGDKLKLWDAETSQEIHTLKGHTNLVTSVAFSPDGCRIVSGSRDNTLKIWDAATGQEVHTLTGHSAAVWSLAISPNGTRIASGDITGAVKLWDTASANELITRLGHEEMVQSIAFSPNGTRFATTSYDNTLKLWDTETVTLFNTYRGHRGEIWGVVFTANGRRIASGSLDGTIKLWDTQGGADVSVLKGHSADIESLAFDAKGRRLLSAGRDGVLKIWDVETCRELKTLNAVGEPIDVAFSPKGRPISVGVDDQQTPIVWNQDSGSVGQVLKGHFDNIQAATFSPDARRIASGDFDGTCCVFDVETCRLVKTLAGKGEDVTSVAFSYDGRQTVYGNSAGSVHVYDVESGTVSAEITGDGRRAITGLAISPDGRCIVYATEDKMLVLWDAYAGKSLRTLAGHGTDVTRMAFSPDGRRLSSCSDRRMMLWDAQTTDALRTFRFESFPNDVCFSPNGHKLAAAVGTDVLIYDAEPLDEQTRYARVLAREALEDYGSLDQARAAIEAKANWPVELREAVLRRLK
ncbi:MAG: protein kinase [Pirellulales bacterium]|nr:protein kinase [Pirellulales bacterium]